ncbi:PEP-CTERM sorting domain-containing protein [Trichocoleus sp. FACHB-90]|uniref:PEP-CTERM sorting domain-containing protein n=1 Tax=Cyanophyceae TaxID=3028117 RepID=UPI00168687E9|nr:PEP-CTERM sorting domain-containing protein [Trichocoleus sp. FACHB-90]MBD1929461.1 PEP-CTERM sorting domain-containing protein [Trichocoleus sp. FACHB-90]
MKTKTKLATFVLSTVAISMQLSSSVQAQVINFESLPDGSPSTATGALLAPYTLSNGTTVTFGFDVNNDLIIDHNAIIVSRKDSNLPGYTSSGIPNIDRTLNNAGGNFLLRARRSTALEGANLNVFKDTLATPASFLVQYSGTPVNSLSGELWDVDHGERYLIEALTGGGTLINSFLTPEIPAGAGAGTFDGKPFKFLFSDLSQSIGFLRISGFSRIAGSGFAFDNFNATGAKKETVPEPGSLLGLLAMGAFGSISIFKRLNN